MSKPKEIIADGLLAINDAAAFLSVSRATVYELMGRGELAYVKVGRSRRIPRKALHSFAARNVHGGWKS